MDNHYRLYRSYLLRMWKDRPDGDWRITLQDIGTGECAHFTALADVCAYLRTAAEPSPHRRSLAPQTED